MSKSRDFARVELTPCYVLHSQHYSESSLIIDVFSREHGRLSLLAKGARRPSSASRGLLMAFRPLKLSWSGRGQLRVLREAEWQSGGAYLADKFLTYGFYLNELLIRLLPSEFPEEEIFIAYHNALMSFSSIEPSELVLRRFELTLVAFLGYGLSLDKDMYGQPIESEKFYVYVLNAGFLDLALAQGIQLRELPQVSGLTLHALNEKDFILSFQAQQELKCLMRYILDHLLGGVPLQTRKILLEWQQLSKSLIEKSRDCA